MKTFDSLAIQINLMNLIVDVCNIARPRKKVKC